MKGVTDLSTVKYAILETNGQLSVLPYAQEQPATARQLSIRPAERGLPLVIINDGRVLDHNLRLRGLDRRWLSAQLARHGLHSPQDAYLLTVDEGGQVYCSAREGK